MEGRRLVLSLREAVTHGAGGRANVDGGNEPLQFVVAGLVEEVTQGDNSSGFSNEVDREARS